MTGSIHPCPNTKNNMIQVIILSETPYSVMVIYKYRSGGLIYNLLAEVNK